MTTPLIGVEVYESGPLKIETDEPIAIVLGRAQTAARQLFQQTGQFDRAREAGPFELEPAAQAVFMLLIEEIKARDRRLEDLEQRFLVLETRVDTA